jgi:hypothetical protein
LTPIELLHGYEHALALKNSGNRLTHFARQAAVAQAASAEKPVEERVSELLSYAEAAIVRARLLGERIRAESLTVERLDALCADRTDLRTAHAALSRYLMGAAGWVEKIERVLDLIDAGPGSAAMAALDDLLSEILARSPAIDAALGASLSREEAIARMLTWVRREIPRTALAGQGACGRRLTALFAARDLPICRVVRVAQVKRVLDADGPIVSSQPVDEFAALCRVADLVRRGGLPSGPDDLIAPIGGRMGRLITAKTLTELAPEGVPHLRRIDVAIHLHDEAIGNRARNAVIKFLTFLLDDVSLSRGLIASRQHPGNQALEIERLARRLDASTIVAPHRTMFAGQLGAAAAKLRHSGAEKRASPRRGASKGDCVIIDNVKIPLLNWSVVGLLFGPVGGEIEVGRRIRLAVRVRTHRGLLQFEAEADVLRVASGAAAARYRCLRDRDDRSVKSHFAYVAKA